MTALRIIKTNKTKNVVYIPNYLLLSFFISPFSMATLLQLGVCGLLVIDLCYPVNRLIAAAFM